MTNDNQDALSSLYEVTGNVTDANTVLINRAHLRRLVRENEELRADRNSWEEQACNRLHDWDLMREERDQLFNQVLHLQAELNRLNGIKQVPALLRKQND